MIDEEKTFAEKGYYSTDLSRGSHKEVWRVCEGCGAGRWITFKALRKLCVSCVKKNHYPMRNDPSEKLNYIDDEITFMEKGYKSTWLKPGSHRKVWCICEDCGNGRWSVFQACRSLCHACANKKLRKYSYDDLDDVVRSIDEEKTFAEKCYRSADLSAQSSKEVYAICVECGNGRWLKLQSYRDLCCDCELLARAGEKNANWKGGISFEPYCEKFNDRLREYIREKFGRVCFMCTVTEEDNGKKLDVHHVNYEKECLCDGAECELVPLCVKCHRKTNGNRELWERLIMNVLNYEGWID